MKRVAVVLLVALAGCELPSSSSSANHVHGAVSPPQLAVSSVTLSLVGGAGYTTFDATIGGCLDGPNGVNCNHYASKSDVYMSGGPAAGGLSDGDYYFAVLTPGAQSSGFVEGAIGNLSDQTAGGTRGDLGTGDALENRTFSVSQQQVVQNFGTHAVGTSPDGRMIIGLAPFDDTDNPGGVYILAICRIGATSPAECKFDAFKVREGGGGAGGDAGVIPFGQVSGGVYYDSNANGAWDSNEPGLTGWRINYADGGTIVTDGGSFQVSMVAGDYAFDETRASGTWVQTGNVVNQCTATSGASCTLNDDRTYSSHVVDGSAVGGVFFGNLCVGKGGGKTSGYWSNSGLCTVTPADLTALCAMCLLDAQGHRLSPGSSSTLRSWLLSGETVNMGYLLSVQLATMQLNVRHALVAGNALVWAPNVPHANENGFVDVNTLINDGQASLCAGTDTRDAQERIKTALDRANDDLTFVQGSPAACPAPAFP